MADIPRTLIDQLKALAGRIRALELATFSYGAQPSTPPADLTISTLNSAATYYVQPVSLLPRAQITWSWSKPSVDSDDPIADFMVSITRSSDSTTGAFASVGDVTSFITADHPVNTNVTMRIYAVTTKGVKGPVASRTQRVTKTATAPGQPATPTVTATVKGVTVGNNGKTSGGASYTDLAYYKIHAVHNGSATFTPSDANLIGTFGANETYFIAANDSYQNIAVRLVAVNTSGLTSAASTGVVTAPKKVLDTDSGITLPTGSAYSDTGNLVIDGSFETEFSRTNRIAPINAFSYVNDGALAQHGNWFIKADCTINPGAIRSNYITNNNETSLIPRIIVKPGTKYYLSSQVRNIGADGDAWIFIAWINNAGSYSYSNLLATASDTSSGDWELKQGVFTAPDDALFARIAVSVRANCIVGEWHFDAVQFREVLGTVLIEDGAITRAKIGDAAIGTAQIEEVDAAVVKSGKFTGERLEINTVEGKHLKFGAVGVDHLSPTVGSDIDIASNAALGDMASKTVLDGVISNVGALSDSVEALNNVVEIDTNGVTISQQGSPFSLNLNNSSLDFYEGSARVAYINGQRMYIKSAEITDQLKIGVHIIEKYDTNNTFIRWVG